MQNIHLQAEQSTFDVAQTVALFAKFVNILLKCRLVKLNFEMGALISGPLHRSKCCYRQDDVVARRYVYRLESAENT